MRLNLVPNVVFYGRPDILPGTRTLHAGPLNALFEEGDLRYIKFGEHEVLRRIYVAVRDRNWGTIRAVFSNWQIDVQSYSFHITFQATHQQGDIDFFWDGEIRGEENGTITYTMDGIARSTFWRNRIGFCVLHPATCAGAAAVVEHVDSSTEKTTFPLWIVEDQPVPPFSEMRTLSHQVAAGLWATVSFAGEIFEMEDQRNWTDASFKTFGTPLRLPFPVKIEEGTRIRQTLTLVIETAEQYQTSSVNRNAQIAPRIQLSNEPVTLPQIGLSSASHGEPLTLGEIEKLAQLGLDHLRVDLNLSQSNWHDALTRATRESNALDIPLEIALLLTDGPDRELETLRQALNPLAPKVKRWLIYPIQERFRGGVPLREMVTAARKHLAAYNSQGTFAAGTNTDFIFLSRNPAPLDLLDAVCFQINPQVHAFDQLSLIETLQAQQYVVESARHFAANPPVIVSPVTFKMRFNPYGLAPETLSAPDELPPQVDPRQMSLFGAVWTAGSIKYLAQAGAASVTYYETTGWRGVMETEHGSLLPEKFISQPGMLFPLFHVFADVLEMRSGHALRATSSDPLQVEALALKRGEQTRVLVCNMTHEARTVTVENISAPKVQVKHLNEQSAEEALLDGVAFRVRAGEWLSIEDGNLNLRLMPYQVARVDF